MASPTVNIGTGTTIAFGSEFSAAPSNAVYEVTSLNWNGITRGEVESTHMGTDATPGATEFGSKTWKPTKMIDSGTVEVEGHFNPDITPPIARAIGALTVTWPGSTTWVGSAVCTDFSITDPFEDKMGFVCTMQMTAGITINVP